MLQNDFFNSFIELYRPYIKATKPILDHFDLHSGQWLVLKDIAKQQPTTLVQISKRRFIEKPTTRQFIKALSEKGLLTITPGHDKREKVLNLSPEGDVLYQQINDEVSRIQIDLLAHASINEKQMEQVINMMASLHQIFMEEDNR